MQHIFSFIFYPLIFSEIQYIFEQMDVGIGKAVQLIFKMDKRRQTISAQTLTNSESFFKDQVFILGLR